MNCNDFVHTLEVTEKHILLEVIAQVYQDANLYEWMCNQLGISTDERRDLFERIVAHVAAFQE